MHINLPSFLLVALCSSVPFGNAKGPGKKECNPMEESVVLNYKKGDVKTIGKNEPTKVNLIVSTQSSTTL